MEKSFVEKAELCLRTVEDNVNFALSLMRAAKFNRNDSTEHHRNVALARMKEVRAFAMNWAIAADAQRIEAGTDETLQAAQPEGREPGGEAMRPTPTGQPKGEEG